MGCGSGDPCRRERAESGLTRADLIRRAAGGGAGLFLLGGALPRGELSVVESAFAAPARLSAPPVHTFVSRPDLRPPLINVLTHKSGLAGGLIFLAPSSGPGNRGGYIVDDTGEPVYVRTSNPYTTMDFRPGVYKNAPCLTWWEGKYVKGVGRVGNYVVLDATYREIARFPVGNGRRSDFHEVLMTDKNTLLVTAYETDTADLSKVGGRNGAQVYGGVVQELAIPSGKVLWEWRSLEHVPITETMSHDIGNPFDYFHINSIDVDSDGNLIVSARNTWAVYKVDRDTGNVLWRLGGRQSDFAMGSGAVFAFQHDARSHDGGKTITIFDNGPDPGQKKPQSRAMTLALDVERKKATLKRQLRHYPALYARVTGNHQILPNRNEFVTWGNTGWFTEYAPNGSVRLDARLPEGGQNYRVFRFPWVGKPAEPPVVVAKGSGGPLYVSWNGATEVAAWQLQTGTRATGLTGSGSIPRAGFETMMQAPAGAAYAAAVALDASGRPIGRSKTIKL
jgi:outer membrane protein assembly factor BamB